MLKLAITSVSRPEKELSSAEICCTSWPKAEVEGVPWFTSVCGDILIASPERDESDRVDTVTDVLAPLTSLGMTDVFCCARKSFIWNVLKPEPLIRASMGSHILAIIAFANSVSF